ncbi:Cysteine proteinase inhibitor 12 [Acorus gramineus]|uniref:Cysteine proteinase inhibitor 12 n=1 Tax=Acorus gramineus TaxID=55184 RepID=A0AAV9B0Q4_ACOGR|nr:Cysteine proteinase inhibitor 12 [Acorus gramineus]
MEFKQYHIKSLLLLLSVVFAFSGGLEAAKMTGGYNEIPNASKDPHAIALGAFVVDQYNAISHASLKFIGVLEALEQVVAGSNYKMAILAFDKPYQRVYKAMVQENLNGARKLTYFEAVLA